MAKALIIGYGNPLRGDDGLGWHAAQRLAAVLEEPEVQVIACHQLTPELAEPISRATWVVFIDAVQQEPAGRLSTQRITPETALPGAFSHHLTPLTLLAWAQELYGRCPEATLFSVSSQCFDCSEELSLPVAAAVPELVQWIYTLVSTRKNLRYTSETDDA
jgi:hydrogenase maturation protease